MEENTTSTTTTTANSGANNSMMLIIGAIVLAAILGYVVFSSANSENDEMAENNDAMMEESTEDTSTEQDMMMEDTTMQEGMLEDMPEMETMDLNVTQDGTGAEMDTRTTNPDVKEFTLEAGSFYYRPNTITVNAGDTVRVTMNSVDMMHDFTIDELGVKMPVTQSGQTNTVEFTVTEAGTYEFYCSVGQHRQQGQVGTLIVQ